MKKAMAFEDMGSLEILGHATKALGVSLWFLVQRHVVFILLSFIILENVYLLISSVR